MPDFSFENKFGRNEGKTICGVDEVGRGPLAGPVFAAAVIVPRDIPRDILVLIDDSKKTSAVQRQKADQMLRQTCIFYVAQASVEEIDAINILQASLLAMRRAVEGLCQKIDHALVDGNQNPKFLCPTTTLIKGDSKSVSIAAASIIAKVARDHFMTSLATEFHGYGWERNMGYGTAEHLAALEDKGVTAWHRKSFAPVTRLVTTRMAG